MKQTHTARTVLLINKVQASVYSVWFFY